MVVGGVFTRKIKPPKLTGRYYTLIKNFFAFTANSNFSSVRRYLILSDFEGGVGKYPNFPPIMDQGQEPLEIKIKNILVWCS